MQTADPESYEENEESKKIEFEYTNTNEMEELQASNAYAEFMQIF